MRPRQGSGGTGEGEKSATEGSGRAGVAPRLYLRKLVAEVLDRVDQFADFDPRRHYAPTLDAKELTAAERAVAGADSVDDIELDP